MLRLHSGAERRVVSEMSSLADLSEIVGFFSYSREDDGASDGSLSALRVAIQRELSAQLGRSRRTWRTSRRGLGAAQKEWVHRRPGRWGLVPGDARVEQETGIGAQAGASAAQGGLARSFIRVSIPPECAREGPGRHASFIPCRALLPRAPRARPSRSRRRAHANRRAARATRPTRSWGHWARPSA